MKKGKGKRSLSPTVASRKQAGWQWTQCLAQDRQKSGCRSRKHDLAGKTHLEKKQLG